MKTQTLGVVVGKVVVERETMVVVLETDNETRSLIGYLMQNNFVKKMTGNSL